MFDRIDFTEITGNLTLLYVEDEESVRLTSKLRKIFKNVIVAENGLNGISLFEENQVDLVMTDYLMPELNGMEFIKRIREKDTRVPIIMITGYIDTEFLIEAINLGVNQFITKPIIMQNLMKAVEIAVQGFVLDNLAQISRQQELELLRYREKYHSTQQELAFLKELKIIRNDLNHIKLETGKAVWHAEICYVPLDILSGDSYSIREIAEGRVLFFISDAMGKGLSASVTSILTTSFVNHLIDESIDSGGFDFTKFLKSYTSFIKKELLAEEIICAAFVYIDFHVELLKAAIFSMPPVLALKSNGQLLKINSNNLPIMKYLNDTVTSTFDISGIEKILIYSDGLNESPLALSEGGLYHDYIDEDFSRSCFKNNLYQSFIKQTATPEDDVTFIFIQRLETNWDTLREFTVLGKVSDIDAMTADLHSTLNTMGLDQGFIAHFLSSLTELMVNAYEHGILGIPSTSKQTMTSNGTYDDYRIELERHVNKNIYVSLGKYTKDGKDFLTATVRDEGAGFNAAKISGINTDDQSFTGRGIKIAKTLSDCLLYNKQGNEALLIKEIPAKIL
ncbi:response regulator [Candidatus Magnetominusculus xianensis]|uniref:Transcriptional regulator n=1 Tax=Candidatus Magnetominusculus xianensis TaxID=1748249 RepID=A0ABR5SEA1_9BACT|nr:response regulator [Candidatus Magnetominusculus xianensis]KWT84110.1 transcriptional regulator [Candidatus Magnetominusculus xianensis]MBF0402404.1 response regulator [Nitrospirota bacterium]